MTKVYLDNNVLVDIEEGKSNLSDFLSLEVIFSRSDYLGFFAFVCKNSYMSWVSLTYLEKFLRVI